METESTDDINEGPLDPRIQIELENLNSATDDINKLEIKLDDANNTFNKLYSESTKQLKSIIKKLGSGCIEKAKCYYEVLKIARQAQVQCQHQAHLYQRASEMHAAAKETVAVAEARFLSHKHEWKFDQAWQDMLNHGTMKVMEAENHKTECGREHQRMAMLFHEAEKKAQELEEKHRKLIAKAQVYFDVLSQCEQKLSTQKERVKCLEKAVKEAKRAYATSFRALEQISNEIHEQRRDYDLMVKGPREPGVGAELISPPESLHYEDELNKITLSRVNSIANISSSSELDDDRMKDFQDVVNLRERVEQGDGSGSRSVDGSESISSQWELELKAGIEKFNDLTLTKNNWGSLVNDRKLLDNCSAEQSLMQSPINNIFNKSKLAIKNSLSKSLTNSPVNISFSFNRSKTTTKEDGTEAAASTPVVTDDNHEVTDSNSIDNHNQKDLHCKDNNCQEIKTDNFKVPTEPNQFEINCNNYFKSNSVNSSPVKTQQFLQDNSTNKFIDNPEFSQTTQSKLSTKKELPLLSIFERSETLKYSKDKSCSMINLAEKQNLKSLLDNSELKNIQLSPEKLANARYNLLAEYHNDKKKLDF